MTLSINTNINSLTAQNNLTKSQSALAQATERLSSGLKINTASDNAAGYAISTNFTTQIGGLGQASSNASDAINLAQTTQSALSQVTANLQAIRDLAVQSANGSYTNADRKSIDLEVQQRLAEVTRIANQTDFNGQKVLDGSLGNLSFQVGANVGQTISVAVSQGVKASQIGAVAEVSSGTITGLNISASNPLTFTVAGGSLLTVASGHYTTVSDLVTAINAQASGIASVDSNGELKITAAASNDVVFSGSAASQLGFSGAAATVAGGTSADSTGAVAAVSSTALSGLTTVNINGTDVSLSGVTSLQGLSDTINAANISGVSTAVNAAGTGINFYSSDTTKGLNITDTTGNVISNSTTTPVATNGNGGGTYTEGTTAAVGGSLAKGSVGTVDSSNDLISRIDVALNTVSNLNSTLGAIQNRFESTISTLSSQKDNLSSSQSTIRDADFAAETANLSKANIMQQAGISVLAQANSQPQQVLKLLQ